MAWFSELWRRLLFLFRKDSMTKDLAEEMRLHMQLRAEEHSAGGMSAPDSQAQAKRGFGNVTQLSERGREVWGWTFLETLASDVRYGLRALRADPVFTLTAVASLAMGIGANTAMFSILNAVMLRSLPVADAGRLVQLKMRRGGQLNGTYTSPIWEEVRDHQQALSGALAYGIERFDLASRGESQFGSGTWVSGDFFKVLGVPAIQGRVITTASGRVILPVIPPSWGRPSQWTGTPFRSSA